MSTVSQQVDGNGNIIAGSGDVHSSTFNSKGGDQNVAQGQGAIGQQINNYYGSQPAPPPIPHQLPALEACFLHREEELVWLNDRLHPGKVAAVCGPGGMGKSALAAQAVDKLEAARFPDGIIFHSFYHQPKVETALQAICAAYQVEAKAGLETAVRATLAGRKALLILDGAEQADDLPALLRLRGGCGVLITSRKRTDALADRLDLKPLDEQPAAEVFRLYSGVAADDAGVQGICKLLGGWPVALRIAGRYLSTTGESAADYLQWLEQEPFKELAGGQHQEENAALLLRRSVDAVSADARLALGVAGCLAFAPIAREPVAAILDDDERRSRAALNELVNYGLLEKREERWQISHALVHTYARTELALSKERLELLAWLYIHVCQAASEAGIEGYAFLDNERAHYLRLIESCLNSELLVEVNNLAGIISIYLERQGWWIEELSVLEMNLTAARKAGKRWHESWCLNSLGVICWKRGDHEKALAYYTQSLLIRRELDDKEGLAATLCNIGDIYSKRGDYENATEHLKQSLKIQRETGNRRGEGMTLISLGFLYDSKGDYEQARQQHEQALLIWKEINDRSGEGATRNNIAMIYRVQGNLSMALEHIKQSLAIRLEIGDRAGETESSWNLGLICKDLGDLATAEKYISHAVQIAEKIGHPKLEECREGFALLRAARQA